MEELDQILVSKSQEALHTFFKDISKKEHSLGLCGGWAVYLLLKKRGIEHIGSRDIDLFFDPDKMTLDEVAELIESHGFVHHSTFRWCKYVLRETGEEITEEQSKEQDLYNIATVYVDLLSPRDLHTGMVMAEPILEKVIAGEHEYCKVDDVEIVVPNVKTMIEMKLKSVVQRTDSFKRTKDLMDMYDLLRNEDKVWKHDSEGLQTTPDVDPQLQEDFQEHLPEFMEQGNISTASTALSTTSGTMFKFFKKVHP